MHTSIFKTCKIHHCSDYYWGEIIISNKGSNCTPIGDKSDIKYTTKELCKLYKKLQRLEAYELNSTTPVTIMGMPDNDYGTQITIAPSDIEAFVSCFLIEKIQDKLKLNSEVDTDTLLKIVELLKIDW